jgi:uncharacterized iron-regulated membrane protein
MKIKPVLLKLHRWVGLGICLWAAGLGLSGTILAFREQIESVVYPSYFLQSPAGAPNFDKMVESVQARYPDRQIVVFHRDGVYPNEAMHINLSRRSTEDDPVDIQAPTFNALFDPDIEVFVNPATGEILGERPFLNWMHIIYDFHTTLLAPINGKSYMGALGLALFFILISGIVYWWPRANWFWRSFRVVTDRGPRRFLRDIHTVGGAVTAIFLILSVTSGLAGMGHRAAHLPQGQHAGAAWNPVHHAPASRRFDSRRLSRWRHRVDVPTQRGARQIPDSDISQARIPHLVDRRGHDGRGDRQISVRLRSA